MTNEEFVRQAYALAEVKDIAGWIACGDAALQQHASV